MILHGEVAECLNHGNLVIFKPITTDLSNWKYNFQKTIQQAFMNGM
jgi:hypothetical protein